MRSSIYEVKLVDLLPPNLKDDPDIAAASEAIDESFLAVVNETAKCIIMPAIDRITDHALLDLLAWDRHVDNYDQSLSLEQKQQIIKNSYKWHMTKGTPAAVEELVATIFGDGVIEEWFEYNGDPFMFEVHTNNDSATNEKAEEFYKAVNAVKNLRSHLERVVITRSEEMDMFFMGAIHIGEHVRFQQEGT